MSSLVAPRSRALSAPRATPRTHLEGWEVARQVVFWTTILLVIVSPAVLSLMILARA